MIKIPSFDEWKLNEEAPATEPKFKVGDKVVSKTGNVLSVKDTKIPRTRSGRSQPDMGDQVSGIDQPLEITDIKPYSYFIQKIDKGAAWGYFLKDKDGKEYIGFERGLEDPDVHSKNEKNAILMFHYFSKLSGANLMNEPIVSSGSGRLYADFEIWGIYGYLRNKIISYTSYGSHVADYFRKETAEKVAKFLEENSIDSIESKTYEVKKDRKHVDAEEVKKLVLRLKPDFKESDLEDVRGFKVGKESGII